MTRALLAFFLLTAFSASAQIPQMAFHSGFEPDTKDTAHTNMGAGIIGTDMSVPPPNDWIDDLGTAIDTMFIQYNGGDSTQRKAELWSDPVDPSNTALITWILHPNDSTSTPPKGRVQTNFYGIEGPLQSVFYKVKMFIPNDFTLLTDTTATWTWLTTMEFWNDLHLHSDYGFRITVNMQKTSPFPDDMYFDVHAQTYDSLSGNYVNCVECWSVHNTTFPIPIHEWFEVDILFMEGDENNGRFVMGATPSSGIREVIFDVTNWTHHPDDPSPDSLTHFNPMKWYTSGSLVDTMRNWGGLFHMYWDDFEIWTDSLAPVHVEEHMNRGSIRVYPNPTSDRFIVERDASGSGFTLQVVDIMGRIVKEVLLSGPQESVSRDGLSDGIYLLRLLDPTDQQIATGNLILR